MDERTVEREHASAAERRRREEEEKLPPDARVRDEDLEPFAALRYIFETLKAYGQMLPREDVITLYSQAAVFVCPSVYEPFGIINLEAPVDDRKVECACIVLWLLTYRDARVLHVGIAFHIGDAELGDVHRLAAVASLEDHEVETELPARLRFQVAAVVPPLQQVVVHAFVAGDDHRMRRRCGLRAGRRRDRPARRRTRR